MLKSTLLDIIRTFSVEELNKFEDFVRSPYFNKKDIIFSLYSEIKKYAPDLNNAELKREIVWDKLFPGKEFNYGIMKNMIHDLSKLCEKFITLEFYSKNELSMFYTLVEEIDNRNIEKILSTKLLSFDKHFNIEKVKESSLSGHEYFYILSKIYWLKIANGYNKSNSDFENERRLGSEYLIYSFLINLYKIFGNLRVLKLNKINHDEKDIVDLFLELLGEREMKKILDYSKANSENNFRILNCYYSMYRSVSSVNNAELYYEFKSAISEVSNLICDADLRYLCVNLSNSLVNLNAQHMNKEQEIFDNYNMMIANNIFTESNGVLKDNKFNNYILIQSALQGTAEMEKFIALYIDMLPEDKRVNSYNFGMAHLNFVKGDFPKSLEYILKINIAYFDMKYYVKNLQMMNYFELDDYESFIFAFDSYKHFTSKNK
ncbi:MAG: hypothetical protein M3P82_07215, partial [Bacteroidota bacterium]|nr:hypothetical protein [Bacteroidota bacterium]